MVSVTALGLRRYHAGLPDGIKTILGAILMGGGALIGTSPTVRPNYAAQVLPGWLLEGVGVGLAIPTIIRTASAELAPHQTSTGSAVVQMGRQLGSVIGVAIFSQCTANPLPRKCDCPYSGSRSLRRTAQRAAPGRTPARICGAFIARSRRMRPSAMDGALEFLNKYLGTV
jgi:MFS family permease